MKRRSYGSIAYHEATDRWYIRAEPHVRVVLGRVFPSIDIAESTCYLRATSTHTAELAWVMLRWPLEVRAKDRERWESLLERQREREAVVDELAAPGYEPAEFDLAHPLRTYQRVGADHAIRRRRLMLADHLGLGKTVTALGVLSDARARPALVVTMAHLTRQWLREAERFLPDARCHVLRAGTRKYNLEDLDDEGRLPDITISNYHKLDGWAEHLAGRMRAVVFDECQEVRIAGTAKYDAAKAIADGAQFVLGMSATPVYNYGSEIWTIYNVIDPDLFGSKSEFVRAWCETKTSATGKTSQPVSDPIALCGYLKDTGAMLLRTRADVGRELPELQTIVQHCDADLSVIQDAKDKVAELARLLVRGVDLDQQTRFAYEREIDHKLRQATGIAKAPFVAEFVKLVVESGESKVVVGAWHHAVYDILMQRLKDLKPVRYTGEESVAQKDESRRRFIEDPDCHVMLMSLRSGAGLDGLQAVCTTSVHAELDWSPRVHEQFTGRTHRDGQARGCKAYVLVADDGSDPAVSGVLGLKEIQSVGVLGREAAVYAADASSAAIRSLAEMVLRDRR